MRNAPSIAAALALSAALPLAFAAILQTACGSDEGAPSPGATLASDGGPTSTNGDGGASGTDPGDALAALEAAVPADASASRWCVQASADGDAGATSATSKWAYVDANGKLAYGALAKGERLLDFSYAGYGGGGVALPTVAAATTLSPSGGDDTPAIQAAIDAVSKAPLVNGVRGAVVLAPGTYSLAGSLSIAASGVVLRGSGASATKVVLTGAPRMAVSIGGTGTWATTGPVATITDTYVPSGASTVHVDSAAGLTVGATVLVTRTVTQAWIHFMGMDTLVRNGKTQTWLAPGTRIPSDRIITAIAGDAITVDAPLSDSLDAQYVTPPGATVQAYTFAGRIEQVGLEGIHFVAPRQVVSIDNPTYDFVSLGAVANAWVRDVVGEEFTGGITIGSEAKWVTVQDSSITRAAPIDADAGLPFQYSVDGQQTLVQRCAAQGNDLFAYVTHGRDPGPNVVLEMTATGSPIHLQPHERWATGLLADNVSLPTGTIDYIDRGTDGSGHGWTMGFGVVWNSSAAALDIQAPPGAQAWAIGSSGAVGKTTTGIVDSLGVRVTPSSLYLAQLCERLGPQALTNIGY